MNYLDVIACSWTEIGLLIVWHLIGFPARVYAFEVSLTLLICLICILHEHVFFTYDCALFGADLVYDKTCDLEISKRWKVPWKCWHDMKFTVLLIVGPRVYIVYSYVVKLGLISTRVQTKYNFDKIMVYISIPYICILWETILAWPRLNSPMIIAHIWITFLSSSTRTAHVCAASIWHNRTNYEHILPIPSSDMCTGRKLLK